MGIQLGVEHVMVGNGYTTCNDVEHVMVGNGYRLDVELGVENVMVGNGYTTCCRTFNGG